MTPSSVRIDRIRARDPGAAEAEPQHQLPPPAEAVPEAEVEDEAPAREADESAPAADGEGRRGRRRRGRRRRGGEETPPEPVPVAAEPAAEPQPEAAAASDDDGDHRRRRRRGRRGGRRRRRGWDETRAPAEQNAGHADPDWSPSERPQSSRPVETPADWTPYPRVASDDQPIADVPAEESPRSSFTGNGDGGSSERTSYEAEAPPSVEAPPGPREDDGPAHGEARGEAAPKQPKRRGWWQRMVE
jgi:ribonuclease E